MDQKTSAASEWKANWTLVLAASVGFSFFSIMISATGLFFEPLTKEFGWSRTLLSSGPSIANTLTAVIGPFFGALIDRYGSRKVVLPGILLTIGAITLFSLANGSQNQWIALWVIFGLVAVSIKSTSWTAAVLGVFQQSRGLALGLTLSGTAVAQIVVGPLANWLITSFGWRAAFVWLGIGWGGLTFLLCLFFLFDAHDRKAKASQAGASTTSPGDAAKLPGLTTAQALRDSALWRLGVSNFVVMALTMGLMIHLFAILSDAGIPRAKAAWLLSLSGVAGIVGKLVTGYLLDRFRPNWIGGVTLAAAGLAFLLLMTGIGSPTLIVIAMLVNGYAAGTKTQITGFLTARYGGMRNFGKIYSVMAALMAAASGIGPLMAGVVYDAFGAYTLFLAVGAAGCVGAGILMITLPRYPVWTQEPENPTP
ncbi:MFS transporter [Caulobacter sp. DWR1-3-2b1]|uniref:MFS transporter n=1 Tax=Caulobacter sp. DWR1-3-2b1 TaxID=2804670 RepID=UPI003CF74977